jgi:hypothetical protein
MSEEEIWEKMVQELKERRANQKKGVMMTAVQAVEAYGYGPSVICMDYASLYPMHISMKSILRKRKIAKIYA